jgi:hypothetical protein
VTNGGEGMGNGAHVGHDPASGNSHGPAQKPRPERAFLAVDGNGQESLDESAAVPLHVRPVLTYAELAALGIVPERTLRRLVAVGCVKRAVLRTGRRVRFVVQDLLDELRQAEE